MLLYSLTRLSGESAGGSGPLVATPALCRAPLSEARASLSETEGLPVDRVSFVLDDRGLVLPTAAAARSAAQPGKNHSG